ncbi:MAG: 50S ribosomal protein L6 [Candidatus Glassbacteria bacterium]
MSRIGKTPVVIDKNVKVSLEGHLLTIEGPKGKLSRRLHPEMVIEIDESQILVKRPSESKRHQSLHGLTRSLINNMVQGVTQGFHKSLEIQGVGYRAEKSKDGIILYVGFSKPVHYISPNGIEFDLESPQLIHIRGIDKEMVGQVAAEIRAFRPPEPYKGKGIRYLGETVRRKAGKTGM